MFGCLDVLKKAIPGPSDWMFWLPWCLSILTGCLDVWKKAIPGPSDWMFWLPWCESILNGFLDVWMSENLQQLSVQDNVFRYLTTTFYTKFYNPHPTFAKLCLKCLMWSLYIFVIF